MQFTVYNIASIFVILITLLGIKSLSSPRTSVFGNWLGALAMLGAIITVLVHNNILSFPVIIVALVLGGFIGVVFAMRVTMLRIPQLIALLNGFGGMASLLVAIVIMFDKFGGLSLVNLIASQLAIVVGGVTFGGSAIAAAKLDKKMNQRPVVLKGHNALSILLIFLLIILIFVVAFVGAEGIYLIGLLTVLASILFGVLFSIRIGGADMPVAISLLNSYSGVAASICGFAIGDYLLISIGAIVGSAGLILTRIMCRAMNRSLFDILTGRTSYTSEQAKTNRLSTNELSKNKSNSLSHDEKVALAVDVLNSAKSIIVVPGYGMALSHAQSKVKQLFDMMIESGKDVRFAIHPVAGRMPGHMNVLLAEVDIPYDHLFELDDINQSFSNTDLVIIVGACDVVNPAAISAEGTPIYGMPILHVHEARNVLVCNLDTKPGYSGVDNPLYENENVIMLTGNASDSLSNLISKIK